MTRDHQPITIGEHTVLASTLAPRDAIQVQVALIKLLGPTLFSALGKKGASREEVGELMMSALTSHADEAAVFKLLEKLLPCARINGAKVTLDSQEFYGDPLLVWQVAFHVLQANFVDFVSAARSRFGHLIKAKTSTQSS
jgi:hypothetical protein